MLSLRYKEHTFQVVLLRASHIKIDLPFIIKHVTLFDPFFNAKTLIQHSILTSPQVKLETKWYNLEYYDPKMDEMGSEDMKSA